MQLSRSLAVLAAALFPILGVAAPTQPSGDPSVSVPGAGKTIPDSYVVVLKDGISHKNFEAHQNWAQTKHERRLGRRDDTSIQGVHEAFKLGGLYGYHGTFDNDTLSEIRNSDEVDYIEEDKIIVAYDMMVQQHPPSWGLSRISERRSGQRNAYTFSKTAGEGVNVYVLDTGVNTGHVDFGGRATWGANFADRNNRDSQGHGTHVAGTIAGTTYGVAKRAKIIAVKVLGDDGAGSTSKLIAGIQWAIAHATANGGLKKSVVNMSLGGGYSNAVNRAVEAATAQGLTFVVAAGNDGKDARNYSPASSPNAITVGATQEGDGRASYSNYGSVVDVFAPGSQIVSTWFTSNNAFHTLSGTSMASPHVAGIAAYLIADEGLAGSSQVTARIKQLAQRGIVRNPGAGTPNTFVWNGAS